MAYFFTNAIDITPSSGSWVTIDLSPYLPQDATVAVLRVHEGSYGEHVNYGLRTYGSSNDNYAVGYINGYSQCDFYVKVSTALKIEAKIQTTYCKIKLTGYFTSDAAGFTEPYQIAADLTSSWTTYNLSSYIPISAKFALLEITCTDSVWNNTGIRPFGSTDTRVAPQYGASHFGFCVPIDGNRKFEAIKNGGTTKIYLHGYVTAGRSFVNGINKSVTNTDNYQTITLTPPWGASGVLIESWTHTSGHDGFVALRKGSTDDIYKNSSFCTHAIGIDFAAKTIEGKRQNTYMDFYVMGYFCKPYKNIDLMPRNWVGEFNNQVSGSFSDGDEVLIDIRQPSGDNGYYNLPSPIADMGTLSLLNLLNTEIAANYMATILSDMAEFYEANGLGDSVNEFFESVISSEYLNSINSHGSDLKILFIKQPFLLERILHFSLDIATGFWNSLYIGNKIVDSGIETMFSVSSGLGNSKDVNFPLTISEGFRKYLALLNGITDPVNSLAVLTSTIEEHIHIPYFFRNSLRPVLTTRVSPAWDITIEGSSIKKYVKKINLTKQESEAIDHIEIELAGLKLWDVCNPVTNYGELCIKLTLSNPPGVADPYEFYLETREKKESAVSNPAARGGSANINIWGRQKPAILAKGFASKLSDTYYNKYASEIAAEIAGSSLAGYGVSIPITWDCDDYWISEFSTEDYPINALIKLAEAAGAIVRTNSDGSLTVRSKFPVKPEELSNETAVYSFDFTNIISMDYTEEQPEFSSVTVNINNGSSSEDYSIEAVDGTCAKPGETLQIKVYIPNKSASYKLKVAGDAKISKVGTYSETLDETVTITNGSGSVSKAIYSVTSYTLHTCDGSGKTIDYTAGSKTITICRGSLTPLDDTCSLLDICYETKYDLWDVTSTVSGTVALFVVKDTGSSAASAVTVVVGGVAAPDNKGADNINNALIITETQAVTVGQIYLYDNSYRRRKYTLDVPYCGAQDGSVASVNDDESGTYMKGIVREASVEISLSSKDKSPKFKETIVVYGYDNYKNPVK
ncbi:MAG: hypothetical protein HQK88_12650 [Nitrospirae bacterium]|nr:hypothetical protein [Nitrospirota bacterium]MBF0535462.1 hypothetical protein [Nitrospirota bacterium]MBF0617650.1 hypothetical protein [Nitrospirota bacterium]